MCVLIEEIYHKKPKTIEEDKTVVESLRVLVHNDYNGLIVVDDKAKVKGVLSLQDVAAATVPEQFRKNIFMANAMYTPGFFGEMVREIADKKVKEIMREDFVSVKLSTNIMAVTADFLNNDLYIVPVLDDEKKLIGVVTRTEIKHALAKEMGIEEHKADD